MERANNDILQQNVSELETANQLANERLSKGEPPNAGLLSYARTALTAQKFALACAAPDNFCKV